MKLRNLLFLLFFALISANLSAQTFTATADKTQLSLDESFTVEYTLDALGDGFRMPDFQDLMILSGPSVSTFSSNYNGHKTVKTTYSFVLQPRRTGKIVISPAGIMVKGHMLYSNSLVVEVTGSGSHSTSRSKQGIDHITNANNKNIFLRVITSKENPVEGEAVTVTYKLYVGDLHGLHIEDYGIEKLPSYNGFWVESDNAPPSDDFEQERYKGKVYLAGVVKKIILFPQKAGKLQIDPIHITLTARGGDPFSLDWDTDPRDLLRSMQPTRISLGSEPIDLDVKPLPANKPANFSGFVGQASLSATFDAKKPKANEAVTYVLTIQGAGNMNLLMAPKLELPGNVDVYEPTTQQKLVRSNDNVMGSKIFSYTIIPRHEGELTIPAQHFSYYNPDTKNYESSATQPFTIQVAPGEKVADAPNAKQALPAENKDQDSGMSSVLLIALGAGVPLVSVLLLLLIRKAKKGAAPAREEAKPVKTTSDSLSKARYFLDSSDRESFYTSLQEALYTYIREQAGLPVAEIERTRIREAFLQKGFPQEKVESLLLLLERVEFAKYAPLGSNMLEEQSLLAEAERIMS